MAQPYPISRESRDEAIFFGDGGAIYGPFALKIFDIDDVEVWTKATGGIWTIAAPTVAKVDPAAAFDEFLITFASAIPSTTKVKVLSARVHERSAGVTSGTKLSPDALEKELTKQGTILQELRRDVDLAVRGDPGMPGLRISDAVADGQVLMKSGDRLVPGPDAADIAEAQGYAEAAGAAAETAQAAAGDAAAAAGAAGDAASAAASAAAGAAAGVEEILQTYANAAAEAANAAEEALAAANLPPVSANTMLVDNATGTARETKTFSDVNEKLGVFPTKATAAAATIDATISHVRLIGGTTQGDALGGLYISTNNGSDDTFVSNGGTRTWYRALYDLPKVQASDAGKTLAVKVTADGYVLESPGAKLDVEDQTLTGGARVTSKSLGTITTGTVTPDPGDRPLQHYTNNGAHTLAPGTNNGSYLIDITNGASAGAITTSGWTKVAGDSFTTTNGHKFRCHASVGNAGSYLVVGALQ